MCDDGCCKGIPNDNVPLFVTHLILTLLATTGWILCAAIIHEDWATHLQAWVVFVLGLTVAQTLYGIWASIVDARGGVFSRAAAAPRAGIVRRRTSESPATHPSAAAAAAANPRHSSRRGAGWRRPSDL